MSKINHVASHGKITEVAKLAIAHAIERHRKYCSSLPLSYEVPPSLFLFYVL
jgi:hypothetical protein